MNEEFPASPSVQSNSSFYFTAADKIKITTSTVVISTWVWWQATYISFIRPTPSEIGQEGMHSAMFLLCCSVQYGACLQQSIQRGTQLHWQTPEQICHYSTHPTSSMRAGDTQPVNWIWWIHPWRSTQHSKMDIDPVLD